MRKLVVVAPFVVGFSEDLNLFSIADDIELGQQVRDEILNTPEEYTVLDEAEAPEAYAEVRRIRDAVLASGEAEHADAFDWEVYLVDDDDDTLNAFCTPGGYMFFYTGLIRYLEEEDHFAGVMGHEMAHAAARHSTQQLTQAYGVSTLIELALGEGDAATVAEVAAGVASLTFSRADEAQADELSVAYLCGTAYASVGAAGFFEKLEAEGTGRRSRRRCRRQADRHHESTSGERCADQPAAQGLDVASRGRQAEAEPTTFPGVGHVALLERLEERFDRFGGNRLPSVPDLDDELPTGTDDDPGGFVVLDRVVDKLAEDPIDRRSDRVVERLVDRPRQRPPGWPPARRDGRCHPRSRGSVG